MSVKAFPALVTHGQLHFRESLADLEGQEVLVTLSPATERKPVEQPADSPPPDWLDVEQEAVFHMPFQWESIRVPAVDGGSIAPSVILPEELPWQDRIRGLTAADTEEETSKRGVRSGAGLMEA
jgi:hypothetical protein